MGKHLVISLFFRTFAPSKQNKLNPLNYGNMTNVLFKPFFDILKTMQAKYGVKEIPYYVCVGIDNDSPIRTIGKTISYYDKPISKINEYYHKLLKALNDGYVVKFDWDGVPRMVILTRQGNYAFPYHARFMCSDNYTWLGIEYDDKQNKFLTYCNVIISEERAIAEAEKRMTNVKITKIKI